jgi:hypothetical protein
MDYQKETLDFVFKEVLKQGKPTNAEKEQKECKKQEKEGFYKNK